MDENNPDTSGNSTQIPSNWRELVPERFQEWDEVKQSESPEQFFDQVANMRSHLGSSIRVPSEEAGEDAWNEFYEKVERKNANIMRKPDLDNDDVMNDVWGSLGKPDTPAKYDLPELDDYAISDDRAQQLKEMAHSANLTKKQFRSMLEGMLGSERDRSLANKQTMEDDRKALSGEWGEAMEQRTKMALQVAEASGAPPSLVKAIQEGHADKATMQWLYNMSKQMNTEGNPMASFEKQIDTPADIQSKIDDMMNNPDHAYWDASHPQHAQAVERMVGYRRKLAG